MAAALVAALLAAGCDYWKNLVEEKSPAKVGLKVLVVDPFAQVSLEGIHCEDAAHGLDFTTDASGLYRTTEAGTGNYSLQCDSSQFYYSRVVNFQVRGASDTGTVRVELARQGGADKWYPGEPKSQVIILDSKDTIFYPTYHVGLNAFPSDTAVFRNAWEFKNHKGLGRPITDSQSGAKLFTVNASNLDVADGPDTLTLTVTSRMAGHAEYLVGKFDMPFVWVKRPPTCSASVSAPLVMVGCRNPAADSMAFTYIHWTASIADGTCDSVVFESKDSTSAIGKRRMSFSCDEPPGGYKIILRNTFPPAQADGLYKKNTLTMTCWVNGDQSQETPIRIVTRSNSLPKVSAAKLSRGSTFFIGDTVKYSITGSDTDGTIEDMFFTWGDGQRSQDELVATEKDSLSQVMAYSYNTVGPKQVAAHVMDGCYDTASQIKEVLTVKENTPPKITLTPQAIAYPAIASPKPFQIGLKVTDADFSLANLDFFRRVTVVWGDGAVDTVRSQRGMEIDTILIHVYSPPPNAGEYTVHVDALDNHSGRDEAEAPVPAYVP